MNIPVDFYMETSEMDSIKDRERLMVTSSPSYLVQLFKTKIRQSPIDWKSGVILKLYLQSRKNNEFTGIYSFRYSKMLELEEIFEDPFENHDDVLISEASGALRLQYRDYTIDIDAVAIQLEMVVKRFDWPLASRNDYIRLLLTDSKGRTDVTTNTANELVDCMSIYIDDPKVNIMYYVSMNDLALVDKASLKELRASGTSTVFRRSSTTYTLESCSSISIDSDAIQDWKEEPLRENMSFRVFTATKTTPKDPESIKIQDEALERSFTGELSLKGFFAEERLLEFVNFYFNIYKNNTSIYAPLTSVCQSSGTGKSRLCVNLLHRFPGLYFVFREPGSSGYPKSHFWSGMLETYRNGENESTDALVDNFIFALSKFVESAITAMRVMFASNANKEDTKNENQEEKDNKRRQEVFAQWAKRQVDGSTPEVSLGEGKVGTDINKYISSMAENIKSFCKEINFNGPFLLLFDEADQFIYKKSASIGFTIIRRAIHILGPVVPIFAVAISTKAEFHTFHKTVTDASMRHPNKNTLLPPFILAQNWDSIWLDPRLAEAFPSRKGKFDLTQIPVNSRVLLNKRYGQLLLTLGRPIWSSVLAADAVPLAVAKLKNGSWDTGESILAIWMLRAGLSISPIPEISNALLKNIMGYVLWGSELNKPLYLIYPSDPVVALAAREILSSHPANLQKLFADLVKYMNLQVVDCGRLGESICAQTLLLAMDAAVAVQNVEFDVNISGLHELNEPQLAMYDALKDKTKVATVGSTGGPSEETKAVEVEATTTTEGVSSKSFSAGTQEGVAAESTANVKGESESKSKGEGEGGGGGKGGIKGKDKGKVPTPTPASFQAAVPKLVRVRDFLKALYSTSKDVDFEKYVPKVILDGYVNFTHFVPLQTNYADSKMGQKVDEETKWSSQKFFIDPLFLRNALLRGCAYMMPPGHSGVDAIIPVLVETEAFASSRGVGEEETGAGHGDLYCYTYISIQMKTGSNAITKACVRAEVAKSLPDFHFRVCICHAEAKAHCKECQLRNSTLYQKVLKEHLMLYMCIGYEADEIEKVEGMSRDVNVAASAAQPSSSSNPQPPASATNVDAEDFVPTEGFSGALKRLYPLAFYAKEAEVQEVAKTRSRPQPAGEDAPQKRTPELYLKCPDVPERKMCCLASFGSHVYKPLCNDQSVFDSINILLTQSRNIFKVLSQKDEQEYLDNVRGLPELYLQASDMYRHAHSLEALPYQSTFTIRTLHNLKQTIEGIGQKASTSPGKQDNAALTDAAKNPEMQTAIENSEMSMDTSYTQSSSSRKRTHEGGEESKPAGKIYKTASHSEE